MEIPPEARGDPLPGLRSAARAELCRAVAGLRAGDDAGVHEARRALKRARAFLRAAHQGEGRPSLRPEVRRLRDVARLLARRRDAAVLVETARNVLGDDGPGLVVERLAARRDRLAAEPEGGVPSRTARVLEEVLGRLDAGDDPWPLVPRALSRPYARARAAASRASRAGTGADRGEAWHETRKRAKELRALLEHATPLWPPVLGATAGELHHLTDLLGEGNDLTVLLGTWEAEPELLDGADGQRLHRRARSRRRRAWHRARRLGRLLWAEAPGAFEARIRGVLTPGRCP